MKAVIKKSTAKGVVTAPPSKSMAHRLLLGAGLAQGKSVIYNTGNSVDIQATVGALQALGARVGIKKGSVTVDGASCVQAKSVINCHECGTTLRLLIPIALLSDKETVFTGSARLLARPLDVYEEMCASRGLYFKNQNGTITVKGPIKSGNYTMRGDISSQFISGMLYALPLTDGDSTITLTGKIESRPYIDMTLSALALFGIQAYWQTENTLFVKGNSTYKPVSAVTEGDYSNSAFLHAFACLGGDVTVEGLKQDSLQGDKVYIEYFERIKAGGAVLDVADCPDNAPVLMALSAMYGGAVFTGTSRLKIKESDRGAAMAAELLKFGVKVDVEENKISVSGTPHTPAEALYGHGDHRIVMALCVLLSCFGGEILGAEAVTKSFPNFFDYLKNLNVECDLYE